MIVALREIQLSLNQTQKIRLNRALEKLESLSSKVNSNASVAIADSIPVNHEDGVLKYLLFLYNSLLFFILSMYVCMLCSYFLHFCWILRGHGTLDLNGEVVATLCGVVERVNKLVYICALRAR